jgi:hypothetical protein
MSLWEPNMIDAQRDHIELECDMCCEVEHSETYEKRQDVFWARMKEEGWRCCEVKGVLIHACPSCQLPA